ncbi:MAG: Lrp/AsnC family transcriptional regulator [Desulfurococcales archaeon]|nr:Lrp/AsnC family transcriptional regulator [Desulfurococcales archaeon]MEB3788483.1 Lrp/AsnC family transcriptional regulator [Desulfurococcales archaeon]
MTKRSSNDELKVDERDLQLLSILEKDSRTPWTRVAKEMGVSEATVYLRVKKLEEKGVLEGFSIIVNPSRLGLGITLIVMLRVRAHYISKVKSSLSLNKYVVELYETTGYYNLLAKILAPSLSDINEIIDEIYSLKGVEEVEYIVALREVKRVKRIVNEVIFSNQ